MPTQHGYFAKTCKCGSNNLDIFTSVSCKDCGLKTYTYRLGETQLEIRQACMDWNNEKYWDDEKEAEYKAKLQKRFDEIMAAK